MLTIPVLKKEIETLCLDKFKSEDYKDPIKAKKKAQKKAAFLRVVIKYLETDPSPVFVRSEIERLETRMTLILAQYSHDLIKNEASQKKHKKEYEKFHEFPKMREQVNTMRFILKN